MNASPEHAPGAVPTWPDHGPVGAALLTIARCARMVESAQPVPGRDDRELARPALRFNVPGCWPFCGDALMVLALGRCRDSGRRLESVDLDRLKRIRARAHAALGRLDALEGA